MTGESYQFADFRLEPDERMLGRAGARVELNARYLDALALLVRERGKLVSKDRFLQEIWRGVPVTDEALTQCIRTLRRQLGDDAARPRFIETVPKHGYRFIAPVEEVLEETPLDRNVSASTDWRQVLMRTGAGVLGGAAAGLLGGLIYGFGAASQQLGASSVLLVVVALTVFIAAVGASGVALGIALAELWAGARSRWIIVGGAAGGLAVGALVKMLSGDAFTLLFGHSPGDITGAPEGLLLGLATGFGACVATRIPDGGLRISAAAGGLAGGAAKILIALLGGRLWGGSLDLLARTMPQSRLRLDQLGGVFGEEQFGATAQLVSAGIEGLLFGACIVVAMQLQRRRSAARRS